MNVNIAQGAHASAIDGEFAAAAAPIGQASGLPNWLYAGEDSLATEKKAVFAPGWTGVGFAKDVPAKGDVKPVTFLGEPLLLARDRDGVVRVFQNTCRHRGVVLVDEARSTTGLIRCPYHAWCYDLTGALKQTPHVGGPGIHEHAQIDKSKLGLVEIRSHVFMDVVFVNLSGDAAPFEEVFATMLERWRDFGQPIHHGGQESSFKLEVATNWKLAVENYCESYHLPFVHPGLNSYSRLEDHANILGDGPWSGQLTRVYNPQLDETGRRFADFEKLDPRWSSNAEYLSLYPNVLMGVHRDHTFAIVLEPVAHDRTIEHVEIYFAAETSTGEDWRDMRERNARLWKGVFVEDIGVVEAMQRGRLASAFDGGHFSPVMDESTHHFHRWIAKRFLEAGN
ncbi:MAG: aromatic ring-hydroxylating dioxygenase subunit alpha [Salaquimonas sp.]|jgi:phenylpropionate dioxygenase-like ring-hydroxylating dioxygenase large terminal subunit|nr:aromatic ring-hydroxylating dioxygenase subunit alpha [Salaquimonas sp.]